MCAGASQPASQPTCASQQPGLSQRGAQRQHGQQQQARQQAEPILSQVPQTQDCTQSQLATQVKSQQQKRTRMVDFKVVRKDFPDGLAHDFYECSICHKLTLPVATSHVCDAGTKDKDRSVREWHRKAAAAAAAAAATMTQA